MSIDRFDLAGDSSESPVTMEQSRYGDWVKHDDYWELECKYEALLKQVEKAKEALS